MSERDDRPLVFTAVEIASALNGLEPPLSDVQTRAFWYALGYRAVVYQRNPLKGAASDPARPRSGLYITTGMLLAGIAGAFLFGAPGALLGAFMGGLVGAVLSG
jgi:hypothetical protein